MTQLENALREAEEHLLRAEAEMTDATLQIVRAAHACSDQRLSQLGDVLSTHAHLVGHLAMITASIFCADAPAGPILSQDGRTGSTKVF